MNDLQRWSALHADIQRAVVLLRAGELVAFPTETVYGLGANARNPEAVAKIFTAKGRPADHPLIVHIAEIAHLEYWARDIPEVAWVLAKAFWPGPLTLILKRQPDVPDAVTGGQDTVGLRMPNHPVALELLRAFADAGGAAGGLAAPSANRFGRISPTTAQHVRDDLGDAVSLILDGGPCTVGIESTIVDLTGPRTTILRPGMLSPFDIGRVLGRMPEMADNPLSPRTPRTSGTLEAHYAPRTPLQIMPNDSLPIVLRDSLVRREHVAVLATFPAPFDHPLISWQVAPADPAGFARDLYANLRKLDSLGCARMFIEKPVGQPWQAIADRLKRAAAGSGGA
ncbi:MAG: threonylcarbamoyl-AMP synthase [Gammaproteobacteria bacterium]|nr:threonylcarbamoyl-AMP synthase [Rhodocyclaceae bacterium]MBU3909640.1 threonylcarbamoyl-AMP synthase [Gammaproteobacteria bacterium]MBU3987955.1 threonylcarbamoyl-AMP synthase [Gammaproteobacteria bacterium]MBU4005173.1 threonylcarbamoyl-AMP synthase [Gammaproteobacteria bacterium]MBU4022352.1 threonylcarbamoyl-AMP synthase [Gammaproteobacteria bacterium]